MMVGDHFINSTPVPAVALHGARPDAISTERGEVRREGNELAFTGWVPMHDGYLQVSTRIDGERSDGPLTQRERDAIAQLTASLGQAYGELLPIRHIGSIGLEQTGQGVVARPFDQRRVLANGDSISTPLGEGAVHRSEDRRHSTFSVGPASFIVMHGTTVSPLDHPLSGGRSFRVYDQEVGSTLQLQLRLANGDTAYATIAPQKTRADAEAQLVALNELAHKVFG
jgi:hypothetical protein